LSLDSGARSEEIILWSIHMAATQSPSQPAPDRVPAGTFLPTPPLLFIIII
jgi:hypothetical protein